MTAFIARTKREMMEKINTAAANLRPAYLVAKNELEKLGLGRAKAKSALNATAAKVAKAQAWSTAAKNLKRFFNHTLEKVEEAAVISAGFDGIMGDKPNLERNVYKTIAIAASTLH